MGLFGALSTSALQAADVSADTSNDATQTTLQEVIVTASKRSENLQNVPASITALTSQALEQQGIMQFSDYLPVVPNLAQNNTGAPGHGQVILRGLSTGNNQGSSTVAYLIDDVPFTANSSSGDSALITPDPDLADIDRIEVLRGPQGTLYGASSLGGLIKIVSKQPTADDFSADVHADYTTAQHGGDGYGLRASMNIPLVTGIAALRISGFERTDPGYMRNIETDQTQTNKAETSGAKVMFKIQPSDDFSVVLSELIQDMHTDAASTVLTDSTTLDPLYCRYCYAQAVGWVFETQYRLTGLVANWTTPYGTLTDALSYAKYFDSETTENLAFGFVNSQLPVAPGTAAIATPRPSMDKLTEELRFAFNRIGNFEALGGLYFTNEHSGYDVGLTNRNPQTLETVAPPFDNVLNVNTSPLYKEYAVFGNLTYYVVPALDFTVGARAAHDQQSASTYSDGLLIGPATDTNFASNENPITYLATLRYRPTEQIDTYARFATGYRPGGPQLTSGAGIPTSFKPDTTKNYEIGEKSRWLEGRLTANIDVYYIDWNDIQLTETVDGLSITGNGGKATSRGIEFDVSYLPVRGLVTQLTGAYGHAYSNSNVASVGALNGDTLPFAPRFTGALLADYTYPIAGAVGGNFGITYSYQGSRPTSFSQDDLNLDHQLPGYATLNLRAGIDWTKYSLELRVNNATDKYAYSTSSVSNLFPGQGTPALSVVIPPRTLRLEASAKF